MIKNINIIIFGIFLLLNISCEDFGNDLKFYNSTNTSFIFSADLDFKFDTLISFNNFENGILRARDSSYYLGHKWEWENEFNRSKTKELTLIFLYSDSLDAYKRRYNRFSEFLKQNHNYKIRKFTKDQLDSCNWKVIITNDSTWDSKKYW